MNKRKPICRRDRHKCEEACRIAAEFHGMQITSLLGNHKAASVVAARQLAMWLALRVSDLTLRQTARAIGYDATTVIEARDRVDWLRDRDDVYRASTDLLATCGAAGS